MVVALVTAQTFGAEHFGKAQLGDRRRTRRLVRVADRFLAHPQGSLPHKCQDPAMYQALLGLLTAEAVTHRAVLQPHCDRTLQGMREYPGTVVLAGDITELDFTSKKSLRGQLGRIGDGRGYGYECFNLLAIRADTGAVLGLANQVLFRRRRVRKGERKATSRRRADRQSRLWVRCHQDLPAAPDGRQWVYVFDREGDTTEALDALGRQGKHYVIRSHSNRRILLGHEGASRTAKLHDQLRALPAAGRREVRVPAQDGQPARQAVCGVAWAAVRILPPRQARGEHGREPLPVWALRVWELQPPAGVKPVEWLLLTNVAVAAEAEAQQRLDWYELRWQAEELHKAQKTGCNIEKPQLRRAGRLEPLLGLLSVVAIGLLQLRDAARQQEAASRPATEVFPAIAVDVLSRHRYGQPRDLSVREFLYALARLGGYQDRPKAGPPGWQVLWKGWGELQPMVQGALLMRPEKTADHHASKKCDHL
jgi:Transposase DNA-binding